jgi:hypothetical protein
MAPASLDADLMSMHLLEAWYGLSLDRVSRNQRWLVALVQSDSLIRSPAQHGRACGSHQRPTVPCLLEVTGSWWGVRWLLLWLQYRRPFACAPAVSACISSIGDSVLGHLPTQP